VSSLEQEFDSCVSELYTLSNLTEFRDILNDLVELVTECQEQEKNIQDLKSDIQVEYMKSMILGQIEQKNELENNREYQNKFQFSFKLDDNSKDNLNADEPIEERRIVQRQNDLDSYEKGGKFQKQNLIPFRLPPKKVHRYRQ
jgi:ABC-type phosphate transport system auxiliary subunit